MPLVVGCKLTLPLAKKSNIDLDAPDKDPQKILESLMDIFFSREQMASMTAVGKFDANSKLPQEYADPFKGLSDSSLTKAYVLTSAINVG